MRIVVTGAGTGGHVTPLKAVVDELVKAQPDAKIYFIGLRKDQFAPLAQEHPSIAQNSLIFSGKWRRYPNETRLQRLVDVKTHFLNLRDALYVGIGLVQSLIIFMRFKPEVVFSKGGPAAIPVGIAAKVLRKPLVTHDSDAIPGWVHRLIGRWAKLNAVGSPADSYPYPQERTQYVGVPLQKYYTKRPTNSDVAKAKKQLGVAKPLVFILGGSLGAKTINDAMLEIAPDLSDYHVIHVVGKNNYDDFVEVLSQRTTHQYETLPFIADPEVVHQHYVAADVVISRCGATNTAEISAVGKASVLVPGQQLLDQQHNAKHLAKEGAAVILQDDELVSEPKVLLRAIEDLMNHEQKRVEYGNAFYALAKPEAAKEIADAILKVV